MCIWCGHPLSLVAGQPEYRGRQGSWCAIVAFGIVPTLRVVSYRARCGLVPPARHLRWIQDKAQDRQGARARRLECAPGRRRRRRRRRGRRRRGLMGRGKASRSALPRFACVLPRPSMVAPPLAPEQGVQGRRQARKNDSFATQKSTKAGQLYCESLIIAALPAGDKIQMKCQTLKGCCRHTAKNSWHSSSTSKQCWRCDSCFNFGRFEDLWSSGDLFIDG